MVSGASKGGGRHGRQGFNGQMGLGADRCPGNLYPADRGAGGVRHSALQGEHGLAALRQAEALERELTAELAGIGEERRALANLVGRLDKHNLDLDLLDERARAMLGYVRREELVIR